MEKLNGKVWVGFVINVLVALWGISDMAADGGTVAAVFSPVMAGGMLLAAGGHDGAWCSDGEHVRRGGQRHPRAHRPDLPDRLPAVPGQTPQCGSGRRARLRGDRDEYGRGFRRCRCSGVP